MAYEDGINWPQVDTLLDAARREDLAGGVDLTTRLLPEAEVLAPGRWKLASREAGRFAGAAVLPRMIAALAPELRLTWDASVGDGKLIAPDQNLAFLEGPICQMTAAERTILNLLQHLCGIATITAEFVAAIAGTHARIYDTRKTLPGLRTLDKYAVRCGGGHNHRMGLYDAVLIKDNHLARIPTSRLAHAVFEMLNRLPSLPARPDFIEVECDSLDQFSELLKVVGIDVILLDNLGIEDLRRAVDMRDERGLRGKIELEASGGVNRSTVRVIAQTGVERIAVGAITHSAHALDLGIDAIQ